MLPKTADEMHDIYTTTDMLAEHLHEDEPAVWRRILKIVIKCGVDFSLETLRETYIVELRGGIPIEDNSRRRTMGGVWFYLIKQSITEEMRAELFQFVPRTKPQAKKTIEPLDWANRKPLLMKAFKQPGKVRIVKVTLVGRPALVVEEKECVILAMKDKPGLQSLPNGLPAPPKNTTPYGVYISLKHWAKVKAAIENPNDELIITGHLAFDKEMGMVSVFATEVSTREMKIALKAETESK